MKTLTAKWTGIRPLLMHNGMLADPLSEPVKEIKRIATKRNKTDADHSTLMKLEWEGSLYWDDKDGPIIPSDNIERCIQQGAQKTRAGKSVAAAVFCSEPHAKLNYNGPRTMEKLYADPRYRLRKGVKINKNRIFPTRPMFPTGWHITFTLEFDDTVINTEVIVKAMQDAGTLVGLGDWIPKFGRFTVEII